MDIGGLIINWYLENKRDLPWRLTKEPYKIWLSEIILQQTRVVQGMPYYFSFLKEFPDVESLAKAPIEDILKIWQGLGYYSRAHNMHLTAKQVFYEYNGKFPDNFESLKELKGIGDYTAAAIASFCFEERVPVLDGNVYRVISRIMGVFELPKSMEEKRVYRNNAQGLMGNHLPSNFNQAMMEFGALVCKPQNPFCKDCFLKDACFAFREDKVSQLPVKKPKLILKARYFNYLVLQREGKYILKQRLGNDIWRGLFEFPLLETSAPMDWEDLRYIPEFQNLLGLRKTNDTPPLKEFRQTLSHQRIYSRYWMVAETEPSGEMDSSYFLVEEENLNKYAFPTITHNFVKEILI